MSEPQPRLPPPAHTTNTRDSGVSLKKAERPSVAVVSPDSQHTLRQHSQTWLDEPPPLNYTIKTANRERKILIWFTLLFFEAGVLPLILFFALRWGAHLSITKNLAIITSLIGSVSGYKFANRSWILWKGKDHHTFRPIGAGRWGFDFFQLSISLAMAAFFIPLIIGSSVSPADPRIVALALPCVILILTLPLLVTGLLPHRIRLPMRISSFPVWTDLPPLAYVYVEDVVAVDGGGATEFRQAWRFRYEESQIVRQLIRQMSVLWGLSGLIVGAGLIAAAWTASIDTAYGLCYGIPWLWAIIVAAITVVRTHSELKREQREWVRCPAIHRARTLPIREGKYDPPEPEGRVSMQHARRTQSLHVPHATSDPEMGQVHPPARTSTVV